MVCSMPTCTTDSFLLDEDEFLSDLSSNFSDNPDAPRCLRRVMACSPLLRAYAATMESRRRKRVRMRSLHFLLPSKPRHLTKLTIPPQQWYIIEDHDNNLRKS